MKIATWNVNSLKVRLPHVLDWLEAMSPDVLALQETKVTDENFPRAALEEAGYKVVFDGQKTYNGVALISRTSPADVMLGLPDLDAGGKRILAASYGTVRILNLYVVNGQSVGSDKYKYKLQWLDRINTLVREDLGRYRNYVVVGDFNIAPADEDVYDPQSWHESVLCSTPERERLSTMFDAGLVDTFRLFPQEDASFSWWDYRRAGFSRNRGLRIDLILASKSMQAACISCAIDLEPRRLERPSDHAPVLAEFKIAESAGAPP